MMSLLRKSQAEHFKEMDRLRKEISLPSVIEASGVSLKKQGKDLVGNCPFHADDSASLIVAPYNNLWHCTGCGAGGSVIDWTVRANKVSVRRAMELLQESQPKS